MENTCAVRQRNSIWFRAALLLAFALGCAKGTPREAGATGSAEATPPSAATTSSIYKWIDENGITHYTTDPQRIPDELRDELEALNRGEGTQPAGRTTPSDLWAVQDSDLYRNPYEIRAPADFREGAGDTTELPPVSAGREPSTELDERIAALEAEIARDQEQLKALLSEPAKTEAPELPQRAEFREIARRLPKLQADLQALRVEREQHSQL